MALIRNRPDSGQADTLPDEPVQRRAAQAKISRRNAAVCDGEASSRSGTGSLAIQDSDSGSPLARSAAPVSGFSPLGAPRPGRRRYPRGRGFGDQAPRAAAARRDSRPDSARSSDGPRSLPRPTPAPRGAFRPSHGDDLAKSRHWSVRRLHQSRFGASRAAARGRLMRRIIPTAATAPAASRC